MYYECSFQMGYVCVEDSQSNIEGNDDLQKETNVQSTDNHEAGGREKAAIEQLQKSIITVCTLQFPINRTPVD